MAVKATVRIIIKKGGFIHNLPAKQFSADRAFGDTPKTGSDADKFLHYKNLLREVIKQKTLAFRVERNEDAVKAFNELTPLAREQDISEESRFYSVQLVVDGENDSRIWVWLKRIQILSLDTTATELTAKMYGEEKPERRL
jgi:hypothetical protein